MEKRYLFDGAEVILTVSEVAAVCLFAKEALNFNQSTLAPVEAECGLVLEIGYIIHECRRNFGRINLNYRKEERK